MAGEFVSGIYVESGYVTDTYTAGTYVDPGYVTGITQGSATLTSTVTASISGATQREGTATLTGFASVLNASLRIRQSTATLSSQATVSGKLTANTNKGSVTASAFGQTSLTANLTVRPIVAITASATLGSDAFRTRNASTELHTCPGVWDDLGTWDYPNQEQWQCLNVNAIVAQNGVARFLSSNFTLSVNGRRVLLASAQLDSTVTQTQTTSNTIRTTKTLSSIVTLTNTGTLRLKRATVSIDNVLSFSVDAFRTRNTATLIASLGTLTVDAVRTRKGTVLQATLGTLSVAGRKDSTPQNIQLDSTTTLSVDGVRIVRGTVLQASLGELSVDGIRSIQGSLSLSSVLSFSIQARSTRRGTILEASSGTMSIDGIRIRNLSTTLNTSVIFDARVPQVLGQADLSSSFSVSSRNKLIRSDRVSANTEFNITKAVASILTLGRASLTAFNTVVGVLTAYKIDPYRVRTIKSEGRTLIIEAESRKKSVISENRVNTIQDEERTKAIHSETRQLEVQNLTLTDVAGTPLDVRK